MLEDERPWQKQRREPEQKRRRMQCALLQRQNDVEDERKHRIADLEIQPAGQAKTHRLFAMEWGLTT